MERTEAQTVEQTQDQDAERAEEQNAERTAAEEIQEAAQPENAKQEPEKLVRSDLEELESAVEAILFASGEPVKVERVCLALGLDRDAAERVLRRLKDYYAYERRGIRLLQMEDAWQLCSSPDHAEAVRRAFEIRKPAKLTQPALEVLTIFAYYQPTTRAYVDKLRGVDSSYTVSLLLERKLIEPCGRLQAPGRPQVYRTTKNFLRAFHLTSLDDLPPLPEGGERLRPEEQAAILAAEGADPALVTAEPPRGAESGGTGRDESTGSTGGRERTGSAGHGGNTGSTERSKESGDIESGDSTGEPLDSESELPEGAIGMEGGSLDSDMDTGDTGGPVPPAVPDPGAGAGLHAQFRPDAGPVDRPGPDPAVPAAGEKAGEREKAGEEGKGNA